MDNVSSYLLFTQRFGENKVSEELFNILNTDEYWKASINDEIGREFIYYFIIELSKEVMNILTDKTTGSKDVILSLGKDVNEFFKNSRNPVRNSGVRIKEAVDSEVGKSVVDYLICKKKTSLSEIVKRCSLFSQIVTYKFIDTILRKIQKQVIVFGLNKRRTHEDIFMEQLQLEGGANA